MHVGNHDLIGKIFHFKPNKDAFQPGEGHPRPPEDPRPKTIDDGKPKGPRRSNRLFALHPVVVVKKVNTIPQEAEFGNEPQDANAGAGGDECQYLAARNETPGNPPHGTAVEAVTPVMICNITSQVHHAINYKNYLPIAAPEREWAHPFEKRVFLTSRPSASLDDQEEEDSTSFEDGLKTGHTTDAAKYSSSDKKVENDLDDQWEKDSTFVEDGPETGYTTDATECSSPDKETTPENDVNDLPKRPNFSERKSSDELWEEQVSCIDDLMKGHLTMPRPNSFIRLDSRTTVKLSELTPFRHQSGSQYELHPVSRPLLWQAVMECERDYRPPHEALLERLQSTTGKQVDKAMMEEDVKAANDVTADMSECLKHIQLPREEKLHLDKTWEELQDRMPKAFTEARHKDRRMLDDAYSKLEGRLVFVPNEREQPFHPDRFLGQMLALESNGMESAIGEGGANFTKPTKSTLALEAIADGKPLPSKKEEAIAHRQSRPRAHSNPETERPQNPMSTPAHPLASKHSQSSGAIAAMSERPKMTLDDQSFVAPRFGDRHWDEIGDWRGSEAMEMENGNGANDALAAQPLGPQTDSQTFQPRKRSESDPLRPWQQFHARRDSGFDNTEGDAMK